MFSKKAVISAVLSALVLAISAASVNAQGGGVKGKVRTSSGRGIANATIAVQLNGKEITHATTDADGNFVVKGLNPGKYTVVFDARGYSSGTLYNVEIMKNIRDLGDRLILSVDRGTQVIVSGSVFFKEGTSVTGAKVELARINADGSVKTIATAYTNVSGEFGFRQPEGAAKFRVTASYKGVTGSKDIEVDMAAVYRTAISLDISRAEKQ
jgi:hypothetical protein